MGVWKPMSKYLIDDDFLIKHMQNVENIIIESLPKEEELFYKFSKKFERKINKLIKEQRRSSFMRTFANYGKKVAIIFLIITSIAFATTMSVEAYRVKVIEVITEVWEEFTSIIFKNKENINDGILVPAVPKCVPEGFSILEEKIYDYRYTVIYVDVNNREIFYEQSVLSSGQVLLDTENTKVETIEIDSKEIFFFTNKGINQIYWIDDSYIYTFISSIDKEEIIKMAESIWSNKNK